MRKVRTKKPASSGETNPRRKIKRRTKKTLAESPQAADFLKELMDLGADSGGPAENLDFLEDNSDYNPLNDSDGVDIVGMVDEAIGQEGLVAPDLKIDDSSCPEAPNVVDWLLKDEFLGCEPPYLEQALICVKLFAEYCPHCSDTEWMETENHEPQEGLGALLEKVTMFNFGVCPSCGTHRSDAIAEGDLNFYNELACLAGQRSGKSIVTAMASTYITHRILKMQKPTEVFRVGKGQILHGTFVALTQGQAKDTLWEPFYGYLLESPWFKKYHALLRHYEKKYHQEFFKLKDTFVLYRHRALTVYPAGPDKRILRGRTRIFGAIDEIGWFDNNKGTNKVKIDANGVYEAMVRSLATVRSSEERLVAMKYDQAITAYMLNISSPSSIRDKICELVRQAQNSVKTLGVHAPTWKMNPNITRQSGFLLEEYRKDPITAQRDYGAEPPLSANAFINNKDMIQEALNPKTRNPIKYRLEEIKIGKEKYRYASVDKIRTCARASMLALDAGFTNNSFSLVVGTLVDGVPTIDICVEVIPLPGIPLHYSMIYEELIKPIIEARNVKIVLADRWNSIKLLQDMAFDYQHVELVTRQYSLKYHDFWSVKVAFEQYTFVIPNLDKGQDLDEVLKDTLEEYPRCFEYKPVAHFALQILTVQDTGRTVTKGEGDLTDDLWRAACLFYWGSQEDEYIEILTKPVETQQKTIGALGKALLGSSSSSTGVTGTSISSSSTGGVIGLTMRRK